MNIQFLLLDPLIVESLFFYSNCVSIPYNMLLRLFVNLHHFYFYF